MSSRTEPFFQPLIEHAAVAIIATDAALDMVCWNRAAELLLDVPAPEMLGRPLEQAVPPEHRERMTQLARHTAQHGEMSRLELRLDDARGQRDLLIVLSPIPRSTGGTPVSRVGVSPMQTSPQRQDGPIEQPQIENPPSPEPLHGQDAHATHGRDARATAGVAAWVIDQTQRTRLTERLVEAEKMASLGTLAGGVAQHFNNILGGVGAFVDFALTSGDPVAMRRALQMAAEAAARAAQITHSLLSFSGRGHRADLADLTEVVLTFSHLVERPLAEKNIELLLDLRPVPIIAVEANRMHQALGNLLTNAEEAMPAGGRISITLDRSGEEVVLTFADTGNGIKREHLAMIFEPFFTTKGLLGSDRANPGLGLSVVHGIAVELGGRIEVQSQEGHGAKFILHFPVEE